MHFWVKIYVSINISLKWALKFPINDIPSLVQIMAWHCPGIKPISEPMMVGLMTHVCVTRPQWVKTESKQLWITQILQLLSSQMMSWNTFLYCMFCTMIHIRSVYLPWVDHRAVGVHQLMPDAINSLVDWDWIVQKIQNEMLQMRKTDVLVRQRWK